MIGTPFTSESGAVAGSLSHGGGRPRDRVKELAAKLDEKSIKALEDCLGDEKGSVRVAAAVALLDRAHGKPEQPIDVIDERQVEAMLANAPPEVLAWFASQETEKAQE